MCSSQIFVLSLGQIENSSQHMEKSSCLSPQHSFHYFTICAITFYSTHLPHQSISFIASICKINASPPQYMKSNPSNNRENDSSDFLHEHSEATLATMDNRMYTRSLQTQQTHRCKPGSTNTVDHVDFEC